MDLNAFIRRILAAGAVVAADRTPLTRYGVAVGMVVLGWLAREALSPAIGPTAFPFVFLFPAVALASWFGGLGPGLLATLLGAAAGEWFFIEPINSLAIRSIGNLAGLAAFIVSCLLIIGAMEAMHRANARAFAQVKERKRTEEKLREAQHQLKLHAADLEETVVERTAELRDMVNELQTFSYSIAHDMRAPLRAMGTFAELLLEESSSLSPAAGDYAQRIVRGAKRLDYLIQDALNYTKAALQEVPLQPVNLLEFMSGLVDTYPDLAGDHADIHIDDSLPVVLGNESLLTQCFANLLGNSVKFVAPGTRPDVHVTAETNDSVARIWIRDNGIGISKHAQPRLFGMFQKLDSNYEGTGIGLAICRKAVERMGGRIGVESEPGEGSRFWVELTPVPDEHPTE